MLNIQEKAFESIKYLACLPEGFSGDQKYPIIVHLHGAGSRGTDPTVLKDQAIVRYANDAEAFPFLMFLPQCSEKYWEDAFEQLRSFIYYIKELPYVDTDRIFLSGVSMGGIISWHLLITENTIFKKAIICCGAGMYWRVGSVKAKVWAFHGTEDDKAVPYEAGKKMIDHMLRLGKDAKLTSYEGAGHNVWDRTYSNPDIYKWLLS